MLFAMPLWFQGAKDKKTSVTFFLFLYLIRNYLLLEYRIKSDFRFISTETSGDRVMTDAELN